MPDSELQTAYASLKAQAELLAGGLGDIQRRVAILTSLYLDSGCNHVFSQMAAHGALWAMGSMVAATPDIVLYGYWNIKASLMRMQ